MIVCPKNYIIVKGVGKSRFPLVAFDNAIHDAGIGDFNLLKISSIMPANCKRTSVINLTKGSILYAAYSTITVSKGQQGKVGVAVALSALQEESGVIFECSAESNPDKALRFFSRS